MSRLLRFTFILFLVTSVSGMAQVTPPKIDYIIPDIGTPGMNTYVEIIAPFNYFGKFGTADGLINLQGLTVKLVNASDSSRVLTSPCVVSWDGRSVACQFFVRPGAALGPIPFRLESGSQQTNVDTFFIVAPQTFGTKSGGGVIGSGGSWGTRSKRGAMIVDSLVLNSGTYTISTSDTDPNVAGNQGYLPCIILSRGRIVINSGATINANATGKHGGPGGGGSGGIGSGSSVIPSELDLPMGDGFTGGLHPTLPVASPTGGDGTGTGPNSTSLNELKANNSFSANGTTLRVYGAGPGHPFDNDGRSGGAAIVTAIVPLTLGTDYGGGGNATAGSGTNNATSSGQIIGNIQLVPLHGGAGGASGGPRDYMGGGGGGALMLFSARSAVVASAQAKGANGQNGCNGCGTGSGDGSGGGAGGGVLIGAKLGLSINAIDLSGGSGGSATGTATSLAGNGGVGRFRHDGRLVGAPTVTTGASRYMGPTLDTLTFVDSMQWTIRGTGRYINGRGDSIMILVRGHNSPYNAGNGVMTAVGSDSTWSARVNFPYDSLAYVVVLQRCDTNVGTTQYTRVPTYTMSQAAASVVRLNLFPLMEAASTLDIGTVVCPDYRYDTLSIRNQGTGLLIIRNGSGFQGPNATYYSLINPVILPDTIYPGTSRDYIIRFNGIAAPSGNRATTLRLLTNDPAKLQWDVAVAGVREARNYTLSSRDINLGTVNVGTWRDTLITYTNNNTFTDSITSIIQRSGFLEFMRNAPTTLPSRQGPGTSAQIGFRFQPRDTGSFVAQFYIHTGPCYDSVLITLRGYARSPVIKSQNYLLLSGLACSDTAFSEFAVKNRGNAPLIIQAPTITGSDASSFAVQATIPALPLFPKTVEVGDSLIFVIRVISASGVPLSARLELETNDFARNPYIVDLFADPDAAILTLSDTVVNFDTVCLGRESQFDLTFTNESQRTIVRIDSISWGRSTSQFTHSTFGTPLPMEAQGEASVAIKFRPTSTGVFRDTFYVYTFPCGKRQRITVVGVGASTATKVDGSSIDFGDVRVGSTVRKSIVIHNNQPIGSPPLDLDMVRLSPTLPSVKVIAPITPPKRVFKPGDSIVVVLEYTPATSGKLPAMTLFTDIGAPCLDTIRRPVAGNGISSSVAASRNSLLMSPPLCDKKALVQDTLTIFNFGQAPLDVMDIRSNNAEFDATPKVFQLLPNTSRVVTVRYTPGPAQNATGAITVQTSDPERPTFQIELAGHWDSVGLGLNIDSIDFGARQRCEFPMTRKVRITNTGTVNDTVLIPAIVNSAYSVGGYHVLKPGEQTDIDVTFFPTGAGNFPDKMVVLSGPCNKVDTVVLKGSMLESSIAATDANFGDVKIGTIGSTSTTFTNSSLFPVRIGSGVVVPATGEISVVAGQFPITVAPGASLPISLQFSPTAAVPIGAGTQLRIITDSLCNDSVAIPITGQGIEGALAFSKRTIDYGTTLNCTTTRDTLYIRNVGEVPLLLEPPVITPSPEFTIVSNTHLNGILQPGDTAVIITLFTPGPGTDAIVPGTLTISSDDDTMVDQVITLTGMRASEQADYTAPVFVSTPVGLTDRRTALIINSGATPLPLTGVTASGPFRVISTRPSLPTDLAPGDTLFVEIEFAPVDAGSRDDSLTISASTRCNQLPAYPLNAFGDGDIEAQIELGEAEAVPGERLKIPIRITNTVNIDEVGLDSYTMTIRFNKSLLYPLSPTPTGAVTGRYRTITIDGKRAGVTNGEIGTLEFIAALGDSTATILDIIDFTWNEGKATTTLVDGLVKINPQGGWSLYLTTGQLRLMPMQPNPTSGPALITYETIEPGRTMLYLVNMLGQRTAMLIDEEKTPGVFQLPFDPAGHASGGYYLVLETPTGRVTQPVQIEH